MNDAYPPYDAAAGSVYWRALRDVFLVVVLRGLVARQRAGR
jgi:hypothetical protein